MTDTKALIAEARDIEAEASARAAQALTQGQGAPAAFLSRVAQNARRLAAALEEATVPDGWEVERWSRTADGVAIGPIGPCWTVKAWRKARQPRDFPLLFPTAREAMAALDGDEIDKSTGYVENL